MWFEKDTVSAASTSQPSSCSGNDAALLPAGSLAPRVSSRSGRRNAGMARTDVASDDVALDRQHALLLRQIRLRHDRETERGER